MTLGEWQPKLLRRPRETLTPVPAPAPKTGEAAVGRPLPLLAAAYFVILGVAAVAILATQGPRLEGSVALFLLLLTINLVVVCWPISIYGDTYTSVGFALTMALIILYGVPGVAIVAPLEAVVDRAVRRKVDHKILTNAAMFVVVHSAAAAGYGVLADSQPEKVTAMMIPGAAVATAITFGFSALLLSIAGRLRTGEPMTAFWERHRWLAPHYLALGIVGLALAAAYISLGIVGLFAFLTPALMMRLSMKQYVDKTAENVEKLKLQNTALERANVEVRRVSDDLRQTYDGTLEALVTALDARDQETKGHSVRVARYMLAIAAALGVKQGSPEWVDMQRGALLHDVGKIGVPDSILLKPGKLSSEEWDTMRLHPDIGYRMLREVKFLTGAATIVLCHHERWDGTGYPRGLREEDIPLGARIFSVVDTFDSMTSDRPYRTALSVKQALDEILRCRGSQFDPLVVEAFLDIYDTWVAEREILHGKDLRAA